MPLFNVYRSTEDNEPEFLGVIEADRPSEAVDRAFAHGITSYPGQRVWAEKA